MNEKEIDTKPEEEGSEDFGINIHYHQEDDEDIPFPENWKRESLEPMKNTICDWIDHNVKHNNNYHRHFLGHYHLLPGS